MSKVMTYTNSILKAERAAQLRRDRLIAAAPDMLAALKAFAEPGQPVSAHVIAAIVVGVYLLLTPAHAEPVEIISADKLIALGKQRLAEQKAPVVGFPIPLPPERFSKPYTGHLNIVKAEDYSVLRSLCSSTTAVACSVRSATSCLIMLGPMVHDNEKALQHEMGHCQGWSAKHEDAR